MTTAHFVVLLLSVTGGALVGSVLGVCLSDYHFRRPVVIRMPCEWCGQLEGHDPECPKER